MHSLHRRSGAAYPMQPACPFRIPSRAPLAALLCAVALLSPCTGVAAEGQDLTRVKSEIQRLEGDRRKAEDRRTLIIAELRISEKRIGEVTAELHALTDRLERKRDKLRTLRPRFEQQLRAVAREREALVRQLRSAFVMGRQHRLKILLNQQDPALVTRMMGYYSYIGKARIARITSLRDKMAELERTEREIAQGEEQLVALQKRSERERARLEQARNSREELVGRLNSDIQGKQEQLNTLSRRREQLEALVNRLSDEPTRKPLYAPPRVASRSPTGTIARGQSLPSRREESSRKAIQRKVSSTAFHRGKGKLRWPLSGELEIQFGSKNEAGMSHEGVLIEAPIKTQVRAIHAGQVAFAEWMRGFGLLLIIDHGDGYMSLYGYNQALLKRVGDRVEAGEVISLVGDSGGRLASGLYFAIRKKATPLNPMLWCRRTRGNRVG